jgi:hypothetical protein
MSRKTPRNNQNNRQNVLRTRILPDGSQQWTRGDTTLERMNTINEHLRKSQNAQMELLRRHRITGDREALDRAIEMGRLNDMLYRAFMNEFRYSYKSGGPVSKNMNCGGKVKK